MPPDPPCLLTLSALEQSTNNSAAFLNSFRGPDYSSGDSKTTPYLSGIIPHLSQQGMIEIHKLKF